MKREHKLGKQGQHVRKRLINRMKEVNGGSEEHENPATVGDKRP
jgi:hypothetical protein